MPNWYQRAKGQESTSRYYGNTSAKIFVPTIEDKEQEKDNADNALRGALQTVIPSAEANIDFNVEGVEPYGQLV